MRLDALLISLLVGLIIIAGGVLVINDQKLNYEKYPGFDVDNTTFANMTARIENIHNASAEMQGELKGITKITDVFGFLLNAGKAFLNIIENVFGIMTDSIGELMALIKLPPIFGIAIFAALLIVIAFSIVYMFFRFQPR